MSESECGVTTEVVEDLWNLVHAANADGAPLVLDALQVHILVHLCQEVAALEGRYDFLLGASRTLAADRIRLERERNQARAHVRDLQAELVRARPS